MNRRTTAAAILTLLMVAAVSVAFAAAAPAGGSPAGTQYKPPVQHAYGYYCQQESKKHVAGTPGTPFSKCVTAMAKLAKGTTTSPKVACATESKKHVAGMRRTPYSICVAGGAKLLEDRNP